MSWQVYMLRCSDDSLYTGITTDVERRLAEHNGQTRGGARYTRGRRPVAMIYAEACESRSAASKRELQIKQLTRNAKLALLNSHSV